MALSAYPTTSLVIPVYRCPDTILPALQRLVEHLRQSPYIWELIVVDDGSGDNTPNVVKSFLEGVAGARVIQLSRNLGKGGAVLRGLKEARGRFRLFTDCDLAYPLEHLENLVEALKNGADVAIVDRRHPLSTCEVPTNLLTRAHVREAIGRGLNRLLKELGLTAFDDTQAGLKGIRDSVVPLLDLMTVFRFAFDIELLVIMMQNGCRVASVPVRYQMTDAPSTVRAFKDGKDVLESVAQIWGNARRGRYRHPWRAPADPVYTPPTSAAGQLAANSSLKGRRLA